MVYVIAISTAFILAVFILLIIALLKVLAIETPKPNTNHMEKYRVYIIGAVKDLPFKEAQANFQHWEDKISALGYEVINPLKLGIPPEHTFEQCKDKCYEALDPCEAVFIQKNWHCSTGSHSEIDRSRRNGKCLFWEHFDGYDSLKTYVSPEFAEA